MNEKESFLAYLNKATIYLFQILLVTGGLNNNLDDILSSTEVLIEGQNQWTSAAPLPSPAKRHLKAVTLSNKIIVAGPSLMLAWIYGNLEILFIGAHFDDGGTMTPSDDILMFVEPEAAAETDAEAGDAVTDGGCVTYHGPDTGSSCIFPFTFQGVTYNHCKAAQPWDFLPPVEWCSTQVQTPQHPSSSFIPHHTIFYIDTRWTAMASMWVLHIQMRVVGSGVTAVLTAPVAKQCQDPSLAEFASSLSPSMV